MKRSAAILAAALCTASLLASAQQNQAAMRQIASRVELHPIPTLTLSDEEFLKGRGGKPAAVSGELRIAQGTGKIPTVILVHDSSGIGPGIELWTHELNGMGISTFAIDGFTGRGLVTVGADQAKLGRLNLALDAYRALAILAKHPRVDAERIVLMGFSRGGQASLYASVKRFDRMWNKSGAHFAGYIAFYPDCMTTYQADIEVMPVPVRIYHGSADDYNPLAPCRDYVTRLRSIGQDVVLTEYAQAHHAFDNPLGSPKPAPSRNSQTVRKCRIREDAKGVLVNTQTRQRFSYTDACVERDPHTGFDPDATSEAIWSVGKFLKTTLKLQ
ncbi:MAG: dienelactone hydrolase family protein [Usitatibacter sp.]